MQELRAAQSKPPQVLLTIAGLDPSSGAGLTADLKVFAAHEFYGVCCPTLLTVQSTHGVERSDAVAPELIQETLVCLVSDLPIAGIKIGALGSEGNVAEVAAWLETLFIANPDIPVVLDPVMRASSGAALLAPGAERVLRERLLPLASVVTPNLAEAAALSMTEVPSFTPEAAAELAESVRAVMRHGRCGAVVVTGGHFTHAPDDYLLEANAGRGQWLPGVWVETTSTHGTGCAFSSALLCALVWGLPLPGAVAHAKAYVRGALQAAYPLGSGRGPMHHLYRRFSPPPARG